MQSYRSKEWLEFRRAVIRLDNNACSACGKKSSEGAVLHVHHKQYLPGHPPWEYTYDLCETLCSGCHAAAHGIIPPKFGWECLGWNDLGELTGTCELCGNTIRYTFLVQHPDWRALEVGEICCNNLTSTQAASNIMDSERRSNDRRKRFASSTRWQSSPEGIHHIKQEDINVEVIPKDGAFKLRLDGLEGKKIFGTLVEAKIKAFDVIESGELNKYLSKSRA